MYAGTTISRRSGNITGVHQRIDKIARKQLQPLLKDAEWFPSIKEILHFEGNNGPDGVKRKSPSIDEPWHFIDPLKNEDTSLLDMIRDHRRNLHLALKQNNHERAAFEAAWMAHAIVDGLTPAHHFPLAEKIEELFGIAHHERQTIKEKNVIKGVTRRDTVSKNWQYWGGGGVFSAHILFEFGVSAAMVGRRFSGLIDDKDIVELRLRGFDAVYHDTLHEIASMDVFEQFREKGWTWGIGRVVQRQLLPAIIKAVILGWYAALIEGEEVTQ